MHMLDSIFSKRVNSGKRSRLNIWGRVVLGLMLLIMVNALTGCGKKPGRVEAPPGATEDFPRHYPDPSTDPKP